MRPHRSGRGVRVPEHLRKGWFVWRIVLARIATLSEIQSGWTLADVADANEYLDLQEQANAAKD